MLIKNKCNNLFEEVTKHKYSWIEKLRILVESRIAFYDAALKSEAELDKNEQLADYDFLYSCFKKNEENEELFAQYEVLKYLRVHIIIKCLKYMLGEWTFVDTDKEMLDRLVEIQNANRCMPRKLKFKSISTPIEQVFEGSSYRNFIVQYYETTDVCRTHPEDKFIETFYLLPFMSWIQLMLAVTTGKGIERSAENVCATMWSWSSGTKIVKDLSCFFSYVFNPADGYHGEYVIVDEEHLCVRYLLERACDRTIDTVNKLGFKFCGMCKENDNTPFNLRNKVFGFLAKKCFEVSKI